MGDGNTWYINIADVTAERYVYWDTYSGVNWDFGDYERVRDADQALVVAAPEQAVAVAAGNERSGVDIAAV
ncbi:hypothetical protein, partial [Mycobacterium kansasii]|uniref:hypothetical protein n=1 Tax=Mycobacterium kansasii TaxID=1768 RepID=UPI003AAC98A5